MRSSLMKLMGVVAIAAATLAGCATHDCGCNKPENPHLSLELPSEWSCRPEGTEVVCRAGPDNRTIIYTIKPAGPSDSMERYRAHFPVSKTTEINGQPWVDATRVDGEIKGYTTRYLATVDGGYAVLVTLTAPTRDYEPFSRDLEPVVQGLILRR